MSDAHIQRLIAEVLSNDDDIRKAAETQIEGLRQNNVDMLCMSLVRCAGESNDLAIKQSALLILKTVITKSWSVGFEQFVGPVAINENIKSQIKEDLLQLLLVPENKIRNACAAMLAKIASVDFPDQWPDLAGLLIQLITPKPDDNERRLLDAGLILLRDMLDDAISEQEFFKMGYDIINALFNIAADGLIEPPHRALAVQCFTLSLQYFLMADDADKEVLDKYAETIVPRWTENVIIPILHETSATKSTIALKLETCTLIRDLNSEFAWFGNALRNQILPFLWKDLKNSVPHYVSSSVNNSQEQLQDSENSHSLVAGNSDCTISDWVTAIVDTIVQALSDDDAASVRTAIENLATDKEILNTLTHLALIPMQDILDWQNDANTFVAEEMDLSIESRVRPTLSLIISESQIKVDTVVDNVIEYANNGSEWTWIEAALYLLGSYLLDEDDKIITPELFQKLAPIINNGMFDTADCLFQSRALIVGSLLRKYISIPDNAVTENFIDNIINVGLNSENATVKAASLIAFDRAGDDGLESGHKYQERLFQLITSLANEAEDETPSLLVDLLNKMIRLDAHAVVKEAPVVNLLFTLAAKDTSKINLNIDVSEAFELLAEKSTEFGSYNTLINNALPQILNVMQQAETAHWDYSADVVLALDLLSALLSKGPEKLDSSIVVAILPALYRAIMNSADSAVLQSASEAFTYLILHGSDTIMEYQQDKDNGPQMILQVASRLLDPSREDESGVLNAGKIVQAILTSFNHLFTPDLLTDIVIASAFRLTVSDNVVLSENLVMVFCKLVIDSPTQVVDMLYNIDQGATLKGVLAKWLQAFEVIRGFHYIRQNVLALQVLFELNDNRINSINVFGEPILPKDGTILTRSKASNLKYTEIPVPTKIIKLLISELGYVPREAKLAKIGARFKQEELDDDWEDILEVADDNHTSDIDTQRLISEWFRRASTLPQFSNVFNDLTESEKLAIQNCIR